jgi:hypothetical protein
MESEVFCEGHGSPKFADVAAILQAPCPMQLAYTSEKSPLASQAVRIGKAQVPLDRPKERKGKDAIELSAGHTMEPVLPASTLEHTRVGGVMVRQYVCKDCAYVNCRRVVDV